MNRRRTDYERAVARLFEKVKGSGAFLAIVSRAMAGDGQACMEIGMAVVLDKPLYLLVKAGTPLPDNLRRMARGVEEFASTEDLEFATNRLMARAVADGFLEPPAGAR